MTIQITIIGLGQIGTSVGLALAGKGDLLVRVGHDRQFDIAQQAKKMGAVDNVEINLPNSVRNADLILLSIPIDQIRETMEIIAQDLKEGAVIMDTAPIKEAVTAWAVEILPPGRYYVGLTPVINPVYLHSVESGVQAARADMFHGGLMAIVATAAANAEAVKLAVDFTRLLGASPFFVDPAEMDGLMAATHFLPQFLSAALLNVTVDQPGWREGRKVAGRAYAEATAPSAHLDQVQALTTSAMFDQESILRVLDSTIAALQNIRNDINLQNSDSLNERLSRARQGREKWWKERQAGDWLSVEGMTVEMPSVSGVFSRMLGLGKKPKTK